MVIFWGQNQHPNYDHEHYHHQPDPPHDPHHDQHNDDDDDRDTGKIRLTLGGKGAAEGAAANTGNFCK